MSSWKSKYGVESAIHTLVWVVLFYVPVALSYGTDARIQDIALHFWMQLGFLAVVFYFNYLLLVENILFSKKNKILYVLINAALIAMLIFMKSQVFHLFTDRPDRRPGGGPPITLIWYMDSLIYLIPIAFAIAIRSGKRLTRAEIYRAEAENIRLQSELQHLKFQLQPHFFFNSLNNIYALIETDPDKARKSIHSMSKLMRHLLQASEASEISLAEEVDFLKKYIELMKIRLSLKTHVEADFPENLQPVDITPLLFISIVENAFKHGVSASQETFLSFRMNVDEHKIHFVSKNTNLPKAENDLSGSGIGLINLQKRLQLLYPEQHELTTIVENGYFIASLTLDIENR